MHEFMNGNFTSHCYRDEIHALHVVPFAGAVGQAFMLMGDNATAHRSRIVTAFFDKQKIERMDWPARFPDIILLGHVTKEDSGSGFAAVDKNRTCKFSCTRVGMIPLADIHVLIRSIPARLVEVVMARGGHTYMYY